MIALQVMNGIYSNREQYKAMTQDMHGCDAKKAETIYEYIAFECYDQAQAMLKARPKAEDEKEFIDPRQQKIEF